MPPPVAVLGASRLRVRPPPPNLLLGPCSLRARLRLRAGLRAGACAARWGWSSFSSPPVWVQAAGIRTSIVSRSALLFLRRPPARGMRPSFARGRTLRASAGDSSRHAAGRCHGACAWVAALGRTPRAGGTMRSHNQKRQARSNLLVSRARSMRHSPTASEEALWEALRGGALGAAFKRQVPLGDRYIADFYAPSVRLVVEVDGGVHRGSSAADRRRDEWLRRRGYRVVRVEAALVLRDIAAALETVLAALSAAPVM
ncbi:MAG: DUF559 domain-containing protein [Myxococcales bacterium]|nr:MAG: DUF559 domain-containing protein [Myxococcales bacterium]